MRQGVPSRNGMAGPAGLCHTGTMRRSERDGVVLWSFRELELPGVRHFVSGRGGGVSPSPYDTLNLGLKTADRSPNVLENRRRLARAAHIPPTALVRPMQVHGNRIIVVDRAVAAGPGIGLRGNVGQGDGLVTDLGGLCLTVLQADCQPIFVVDPERRAIGLGHAGWRGAVGGLAASLVGAMAEGYGCRPERLLVGLGPAIGPCCYEVGPEVAAAVRASVPRGAESLRSGTNERFFLDLTRANRALLSAAGVPPDNILAPGLCTRCHAHEFFSERAQRPTGRFAAGIMLEDTPAPAEPPQGSASTQSGRA